MIGAADKVALYIVLNRIAAAFERIATAVEDRREPPQQPLRHNGKRQLPAEVIWE